MALLTAEHTTSKIKPVGLALDMVCKVRGQGRSVGLCIGGSDILELRQIRAMEAAAEQVDLLVFLLPVEATDDETSLEAARAGLEMAAGLECVDVVTACPAARSGIISRLINPDILFIGTAPSPRAAPLPPADSAEYQLARTLRAAGAVAEAKEALGRVLRDHPANPHVLYELARCHWQTGAGGAAAEALRTAIRLDAGNEALHHLLGLCHREQGQFTKAIKAFRMAIALRADVPEFHQDLAVALERAGRPVEAAVHLRDAVALQPANETLHHLLGLCLRQIGRMPEAEKAFRRAVVIAPGVPTFHHDHAIALRHCDDPDGLITALESILRVDPDNAEIIIELAEAYRSQGEFYKALARIKTYLRTVNAHHLGMWLALGHGLREMGHLDEAMRAYRHIGEMAEENPGTAAGNTGALSAAAEYRGDPVGAAHWAEAARIEWMEQAEDAVARGHERQRVITLGRLNGSLGDLAMRFDLYAKAVRLGQMEDEDPVILEHPEHPFVNRALIDCWRPFLRFESNPGAVARLRHAPPGFQDQWQDVRTRGERFRFFPTVYARITRQWEEQGRPPLIAPSAADQARGRQALARMGLKEGDWFVCLHVRDGGYYREAETGTESLSLHRSARIETYIPAIDHIIDRGGWVIRLGAPSAAPLDYRRRRFVDYARSDQRSDWMDVFLIGACRFLLGTNSGPMCVAFSLGTPCAISNYVPFSIPVPGTGTLFTPKMLYSRPLGRYLTFNEMLTPPFRDANRNHLYRLFDRKLGVRLEDNTPEDVLGLTRDMLAHLDAGLPAEPRHLQLAEMCERNDSDYVGKLPPSFLDRFDARGCLAEQDAAEELRDRWERAIPRVEAPRDIHFVHAPPVYAPSSHRRRG